MKGTFTISLDFELHWGGFEKWPMEQYRNYFLNTRALIPEMLALFERYEVHVTWATVGLLFCDSKEHVLKAGPAETPTYRFPELGAYHFIEHKGIGENETDDPFHFAPSLIRQILQTPYQELGSHTFAHYYCQEEGQTVDQFRADIRAAQRIAGEFGTTLSSLVFPRNQFNDHYLQVCYEEGIKAVRSNPLDWFWHIESTQNESSWKRLNRGLDAYFPLGKQNTYRLESLSGRAGYPWSIPASRLLRPYRPKEFFLNDFKIKRIRNEMRRAAQRGEVYHLWWHPHNFGNYPRESMTGLEKILQQYEVCRREGTMQSLNMREITSFLSDI